MIEASRLRANFPLPATTIGAAFEPIISPTGWLADIELAWRASKQLRAAERRDARGAAHRPSRVQRAASG